MYHYPYPYYGNMPEYDTENRYSNDRMYPWPYYGNIPMYHPQLPNHYANPYAQHSEHIDVNNPIHLKDYGPEPYVVNIEQATKQNKAFRLALWTGKFLQLTLMTIHVGEDIGLEVHHDHDQFIRIEQGQGLVVMGDRKDKLDFQAMAFDDYAIFVPAGKWHNLINTGYVPIKLYSIYAPPEHPRGTVHETKAIAEASE